MNNLLKFVAALFACQWCAERVLGNGFTLGDQDAFATARGGAFVATADNPSAIYYNPAGIAQLDGDNLRGSLYGIYLDQAYQPMAGAASAGNTFRNSDHLAAVPSGFYTHTFKNSPWTAGLGVYAPYGGSMNWSPNTGFATVATLGKLTYFSINPALALKLSPQFLIGAGLIANYTDMDVQQWLNPSQLSPNGFQFRGDGWSMAYNIGALWQPIQQVSVGASFRSSSPVTLKGRTVVQAVREAQVTTPAQMELTFPLNATFGVSYRPTPKWNLEFDAVYTGWSSFGSTTIQQQQAPESGVGQDIAGTLDWQDSWTYEFGVTRYLGKDWHVSAGYAYDENSVPNQFYTPLAADLDRHFFSLGVGFAGKTINFDVTYQFGYGPPNTVTGSLPSFTPDQFNPETANGKYSFFSNAVMVSAGIHF